MLERGVGEAGLDQRAGLGGRAGDGGAPGPVEALLLVGLHGQTGAEEPDDAGPGEGQQLSEARSRRAGGQVAEEPVPPAADVAEPDELGVGGEQAEEDREILAVRRVVTAGQVIGDVGAQRFLERLGRCVADAFQGPVEGVEVEPVGGVGHGLGDDAGQFGAARVGGGVLLGEDLVGQGGALGVGGEQPVVVGVAQLLRDHRPDIAPEVQRPGPAQQLIGPLRPQVLWQRRSFTGPAVADLRVVRDAAPRSDVQHGFTARRQVDPVLVASAASFGEQDHQIDEGEPEAPDDDRLPGAQGVEVAVGGEVGGQMDEVVPPGEGAQPLLLGLPLGVEVAYGQDDEIGGQGFGAALEPDVLAAAARPGDGEGGGAVLVHGDAGRQSGQGAVVGPAQIGALEPSGGEVRSGEAVYLGEHGGIRVRDHTARADVLGPGVQGRARHDGAGQIHRLVGEHGDVLGHGVHPQQRRLVGAPDPSAARRVGVDQVDVQARIPVQLNGVGGDALDDSGAPGAAADHHDAGCGGHRAPAVPRA